MKNAADVVQADLEYMHAALRDEWPALAGRRLLITGGAGFLGYYFTHAAMHFNRLRTQGQRIAITVYDNLARGAPAWLEHLQASGEVELQTHDMSQPLPSGFGPFDYIIHGASIASPTYYRAHPVETMDVNINGLRNLLDYACAQQQGRPSRSRVCCSSRPARSTATRHPTLSRLRRPIAASFPARARVPATTRPSVSARPSASMFARQYGVPVKIARPFNNYGPGLKINDGRVLPDFARDVLSGRDIVMFSDGSATRTFCYSADAITGYYKVLVKGELASLQYRHRDARDLDARSWRDRVIAAAGELFGYTGQSGAADQPEADYLVDNPNRRCPIIAKARDRILATTHSRVREGLIAHCSGIATTRMRPRSPGRRPPRRARVPPDESLRHRHGLCRAGDRCMPGREWPPRHLRRHRRAPRSRPSPAAQAPISRAGPRRAAGATCRQAAVRHHRPARGGAGLRPHAARDRHAVRRRRRSTSPMSGRRRGRSARPCATSRAIMSSP